MCPIQRSSCSLFGLCRFFSFLIHFKDTVYFCITNTNVVLCLVTTWFPQTNQLRITGLRYPANVIYGGKCWFCSPFDCRHQLQVCGVIWRNSCREESHVQVLSRWFPQHLEPSVSLRSRWPLLCRRESLELSVCLLCGFILFFYDKPKHVHSCRQRYRPTGCFKTLKNLTRQEPRFYSQVSSMQCMTAEAVFTARVTHSKYIIQKQIHLNHRLQCV